MINTNVILDLLKGTDKEGLKGLTFRQNQLLIGEILEILNAKQALISVRGTKVIANLEIPLRKGQKSLFLVTSVKDHISLKLVAEDHSQSNPTREIMNTLGLKNNNENKKIVEYFIKHHIPIEKETISYIHQLTKEGESLDNLLVTLKTMEKKQIPPSPLAMKLLNEFQFGKDFFSRLGEIIQEYQSLLNSEQAKVPEELKQMIKSIERQVQILKKDFESTPQKEVLKSTFLEPNRMDHKLVEKQPIEQKGILDIERNGIDAPKIMKAIGKLLEEIHIQPFRNDSIHMDHIQNNMQSIKHQLEQLFNHKEVLPEFLAKKVEGAYLHLAGQHVATINNSSVLSHALIQLPGFLLQTEEPIYIQVNAKKKGQHTIDPADIFFVFLFNLNHLGTVTVHMKVLEQQVFIQINNENDYAKAVFKQLEPRFIEFIKKEGFQSTGFSFKSIKTNESSSSFIESSIQTGVDIRV